MEELALHKLVEHLLVHPMARDTTDLSLVVVLQELIPWCDKVCLCQCLCLVHLTLIGTPDLLFEH